MITFTVLSTNTAAVRTLITTGGSAILRRPKDWEVSSLAAARAVMEVGVQGSQGWHALGARKA